MYDHGSLPRVEMSFTGQRFQICTAAALWLQFQPLRYIEAQQAVDRQLAVDGFTPGRPL